MKLSLVHRLTRVNVCLIYFLNVVSQKRCKSINILHDFFHINTNNEPGLPVQIEGDTTLQDFPGSCNFVTFITINPPNMDVIQV